MTTQLLIYERAEPINKNKHNDWSVKTGNSYDFAKKINSVPLTAVEFPSAAAEYSIIFAGNEEAVMPAVILGVRDQENLYVADDGQWNSQYIPAFLRRYPQYRFQSLFILLYQATTYSSLGLVINGYPLGLRLTTRG